MAIPATSPCNWNRRGGLHFSDPLQQGTGRERGSGATGSWMGGYIWFIWWLKPATSGKLGDGLWLTL